MAEVLACASCKAPTAADRIVGTLHRQTYGKGWREEWGACSACADCLSVTETIVASDAPEPRAVLRFPGTEVTRLRDALRRANENGTLRREVGKLLTDAERCVLAGVPEVFPDVLPGIGRHLRLRTNLEVTRADANRPDLMGPATPATEPWGGPISRRRQATAVRGDGPGGVIPPRSVGTEEPLKNIYGALLLVGLQVTVVGVRAGALLVEIPEWAVAAVGGHARILVPWGAATRDES